MTTSRDPFDRPSEVRADCPPAPRDDPSVQLRQWVSSSARRRIPTPTPAACGVSPKRWCRRD